MKSVINNYINGNLQAAKQGAVHYGFHQLRSTLEDDFGYSFRAADAIASYLKEKMDFQTCCDIVHAEMQVKNN